MAKTLSPSPNPRRVEAGRRNRAKRLGLTDAGRERLRQAALTTRPWEHATGPRTPEGRARSAANGKSHWTAGKSNRERRVVVASVRELVGQMQAARDRLTALSKGREPSNWAGLFKSGPILS